VTARLPTALVVEDDPSTGMLLLGSLPPAARKALETVPAGSIVGS
jgi:hypothetical protein